jgi:hypothetical protein
MKNARKANLTLLLQHSFPLTDETCGCNYAAEKLEVLNDGQGGSSS